jgi:peroxiredoxin
MNFGSYLRGLVLLGLTLLAAASGADTSGQQRAEAAGRGLLGAPAPRLTLKTIDGETIDLASIYGRKAVYIKFWATWCTPCREQMPHFERTYESAGPDLAVIAIDVGFNDSIEQVRRYQRELGITMPMVFDGDGQAAEAFHLRVTPQHIVIGRDGRVQYVGHLADQRLDAALIAAREPGVAAGPKAAGGKRAPIGEHHFQVGDQLPARSARILDGQAFEFQKPDSRRPTVIVFLSPWCESYLATTRPQVSANCRAAREQVNTLARDRPVRWLGIASGLWAAPSDLRAYRAQYKVSIPLTLDESGAWFRAFQVTNVPTVIVADAQGKIVQRIEPSDAPSLSKALDQL